MAAWVPFAIEAASDLLERLFPDKNERDQKTAALAIRMQELAMQADQMQNTINTQEAAHASIFVAGWRPFIGWVCGFALGYHYVLQPLLAFLLANAGYAVTLPVFEMGDLTTILLGMLGLGGLRTVEKVKGVTR